VSVKQSTRFQQLLLSYLVRLASTHTELAKCKLAYVSCRILVQILSALADHTTIDILVLYTLLGTSPERWLAEAMQEIASTTSSKTKKDRTTVPAQTKM
jgi:hypothetical protein